ncbi:MFS transporter [Streptomyces sp. RG80]|uniref:MFS transporter n=1 Tax=Streptomyces sp. RG80 TaxID=3157340 RepID=UPI00338F1B4E
MNPRLVLAGSVTGAVIVALDGTVLTIAQPTLQEDLGASLGQVQWTSTGYLVAVASLLVFAGRLGDRYGHRRLFGVGMLGFGATSAGIGLAPGVDWVIGLRVVQGVFGALLQPATLGMLRSAYPPDRLRGPIALRTAAIGVSAAVGPLVGGVLVAGSGWRAVFFLNVVPALVLGALALAVREPERVGRVPLDLPGAVLLAVTLGFLVDALASTRWAGLAVAAVTGAAFVRHERRAASPLIPRAVPGAPLGVLLAASAALSGTLFVGTFVLQHTLGLDPFQSALRCLPLAVLMVAAAALCPVLLRRAGTRRTTATAMTVLAAGILVLSQASGTLALGTGFALLGAGFGTVMVAATHAVVRQSPLEAAGVAGGLQQTTMNVGPTLGVAVVTPLMGQAAALTVLALVALTGAVLATRFHVVTAGQGQPGDRPAVPARR